MAAKQFFIPHLTATVAGIAQPGATFEFLATGTTTKRAVYTTSALSTPRPNPVTCDSSGALPTTYLNNAFTYRVRIRDRNGTLIKDIDPFIPGVFPDAAALEPYQEAAEAAAEAAAESATVAEAAASLALASASLEALPEGNGELMPEMYGAIGDATTNDTQAFQDMASDINTAGGGVIVLRPGAIYLVGQQSLVNNGTWMFQGESVLTIDGCSKPVVIRGNGAILKLAPNLKFGTFNSSGVATSNALPYTGGEASAPVLEGIISIKNCTGRVVVENLEIDGNDAAQDIGGEFGDTGYQLPADGLFLWDNDGGEEVRNVYSHHNLRDGCQILGGNAPVDAGSPLSGSIINIRSEYNGRQGISFVGGRGYTFMGCKLNYTGQGEVQSAPSAGVDLEAEIGLIRDIHFIGCEMAHNVGASCLADSGDIENLTFDNCTFIGTESYAYWVRKPFVVHSKCRFIGSTLLPNSGSGFSYAEAPKFYDCYFSDDGTEAGVAVDALPEISTLFNGGAGLPAGTQFRNCYLKIYYGNRGIEIFDGEWHDCTFDVGDGNTFFPALTGASFYGTNVITGAQATDFNLLAVVSGGVFSGEIIVDGVNQRKASTTYDPASIADGGRVTTTVNVPLARIGRDIPVATFSNSLQGVTLSSSYVSTNATFGVTGVVTVVFENETGGAVDLASGTLTVRVRDRDAA